MSFTAADVKWAPQLLAQYLTQAVVVRYNEEEWNNVIARDPNWSRQETDYLLDLCQAFDLRFMVIADRYEVPTHRTLDLGRNSDFGPRI